MPAVIALRAACRPSLNAPVIVLLGAWSTFLLAFPCLNFSEYVRGSALDSP
jgi:hypothetical protein